MFGFFWNVEVIRRTHHAASLVGGTEIDHHGDELVPVLLSVDQHSPIPSNGFLALIDYYSLVFHCLLSLLGYEKAAVCATLFTKIE